MPAVQSRELAHTSDPDRVPQPKIYKSSEGIDRPLDPLLSSLLKLTG